MKSWNTDTLGRSEFFEESDYNVFFGPGGTMNKLRRGSKYRELVQTHCIPYSYCSKDIQKRTYVRQHVIEVVRENGGKFLLKCKKSKVWKEVNDEKSLFRRISQALRDCVKQRKTGVAGKAGLGSSTALACQTSMSPVAHETLVEHAWFDSRRGDHIAMQPADHIIPDASILDLGAPSGEFHPSELKAMEWFGSDLHWLDELDRDKASDTCNGTSSDLRPDIQDSRASMWVAALNDSVAKIGDIKKKLLSPLLSPVKSLDPIERGIQSLDAAVESLDKALCSHKEEEVAFTCV